MKALYKPNTILIDWLSFTIPEDDVCLDDIVVMLGMSDIHFANVKGGRGYKDRYYYDGVSIHYNGSDEDSKLWVEMSGQGCRVFETYGLGDWIQLFQTLLQYKVNFTRVDIAYDDFNYLIDLDLVVADTLNHNFISKASSKSWFVELSGEGTCVTFGKKKSNISCRIYDKAAERNSDLDHWIRCEIQLRYQNAEQFIIMLCDHEKIIPTCDQGLFSDVHVEKCNGKSIDHLYFGVLNNYIRFIDPSANNDSNVWRKPMAEHWEKFSHSVTKDIISLWVKPGVEYNILHLDRVVEKMFSGAVATYAIVHGIDKLISALIERMPYLNTKYQQILKNHFCSSEIKNPCLC